MTYPSLALLGPIQIALDQQPVAGFDYAKVRALLVYLAVERDRSHQRDVIAELLWPDQAPQVARNSLCQALAKLRQTIRDQAATPPFLLITRETLQFNRAGRFTLDVAEFEALAAAVARHLEDPAGIASALNNLGGTLYKQSDFRRAMACFSEVVAIDREIGDRYGMAVAMHNLAAAIYNSGGNIAEARRLLAESLALWDAIGMKQGTATTLSSLGQLALIQGDNAAAARFFEESLVTLRELGDLRSASLSLTGLGRALHRQGDNTPALDAYDEALALRHELGDKLGIAECLEGLGEIALAQGAPARTIRLYGAAGAIRAAIGSPVLPVDRQAYDETLTVARAQLDPQQAEELWAAGQALPIDGAVALARSAR